MASGVYYFDNLGALSPGSVFGGQPGPGETPFSVRNTACRTGDPVGTGGEGVADGTGVIILGGNTTISVGNNSTFEIFTRQPATDDGSTPGISLYQVPLGAPAPWAAAATTLPQTTSFLDSGKWRPR